MTDAQKEKSMTRRLYIVDNESWWLLLVAGIISLVFGIIIAAWPKASSAVLVILVGIAILLVGIIALIRSFTLIKKAKNWWILLIEGIVGIVIAIVLFAWPVGTTAFLAYIIGALLVLVGILAIIYGIRQKSVFPIIGGAVSLIIGLVVLFTSPANAFSILMILFGIFLIIRGIILIIQSIIRKRQGPVVTEVTIDSSE
jgi:uncharacterized membrane protein HdeD (DUF308 family)